MTTTTNAEVPQPHYTVERPYPIITKLQLVFHICSNPEQYGNTKMKKKLRAVDFAQLTKVLSSVAARINLPLGENLAKDTGGLSSSMRVLTQ
jgi:hypothetical protein